MILGPMSDHPQIPLRPDPRIGNMPPGWMTWDDFHAGLIHGLNDDDVEWLERHWLDSGGGEADPSGWIKMETIGGPPWPFLVFICVMAAVVTAYVAVTL